MTTVEQSQVTEHTPGPWRVVDETDILALEGTPSSIVVASTKFFEGPATSWECANARLIAAAPELLEALVMLMHCGPHPRMGEWKRAIQNASAAIDKAEGRS
jgi:hypothetical protein